MAENEFGMDCHYASLAVEGKFFECWLILLQSFQCLMLLEFAMMLLIILLLLF
jgi:hypothetical protein